MLETSIAHTEKRSRRIEAILVISLTVFVFVFFGFLQENQSAILDRSSRMMGSHNLRDNTYVDHRRYIGGASYLKRRFYWTVYVLSVV